MTQAVYATAAASPVKKLLEAVTTGLAPAAKLGSYPVATQPGVQPVLLAPFPDLGKKGEFGSCTDLVKTTVLAATKDTPLLPEAAQHVTVCRGFESECEVLVSAMYVSSSM